MIKKYLAYLFFVFSTLFLGCESLSPEEKSKIYPVLIERVDQEALKALNEQYHSDNDGLICSTLNEYALTGFSRILFQNDENPCLNRVEIKKEVQFESRFLEVAKQSLLKNSTFTGVTEIESLTTSEIIPLDGCTVCEGPDINNVPLEWKFEFESQEVNGIKVLDTRIVVYMDANGVNRIWGNWYEVTDPGFVEYGSNHAKEVVTGLKLRYANEQNHIFEQVVTLQHLKKEPELVFSPIEVEKGLEIHKVWEVEIVQQNSGIVTWKVYISTINGKVVGTTLL